MSCSCISGFISRVGESSPLRNSSHAVSDRLWLSQRCNQDGNAKVWVYDSMCLLVHVCRRVWVYVCTCVLVHLYTLSFLKGFIWRAIPVVLDGWVHHLQFICVYITVGHFSVHTIDFKLTLSSHCCKHSVTFMICSCIIHAVCCRCKNSLSVQHRKLQHIRFWYLKTLYNLDKKIWQQNKKPNSQCPSYPLQSPMGLISCQSCLRITLSSWIRNFRFQSLKPYYERFVGWCL